MVPFGITFRDADRGLQYAGISEPDVMLTALDGRSEGMTGIDFTTATTTTMEHIALTLAFPLFKSSSRYEPESAC
jgi:hypothetical protein